MNTTPDHPDFTALALGEHIHGTPARAVLDALRTSVAARQEAEQLRDTAAQLSFVLKGQPPQRLDHKRRNAIFNADVAALRERFAAEERAEEQDQAFEIVRPPVVRRHPSWIYPSVAAAAVAAAAVAVLRMLPGHEPSVAPAPSMAQTDHEPGGRILVSTGPPAASRAHAPRTQAMPAPSIVRQENTAPVAQETVKQSPVAPAPKVVREYQAPPSVAIPELPPTRPPYRNDMRDYASPPRVPQRGR
jgi:hypothetical protein